MLNSSPGNSTQHSIMIGHVAAAVHLKDKKCYIDVGSLCLDFSGS